MFVTRRKAPVGAFCACERPRFNDQERNATCCLCGRPLAAFGYRGVYLGEARPEERRDGRFHMMCLGCTCEYYYAFHAPQTMRDTVAVIDYFFRFGFRDNVQVRHLRIAECGNDLDACSATVLKALASFAGKDAVYLVFPLPGRRLQNGALAHALIYRLDDRAWLLTGERENLNDFIFAAR